MAVDQSKNKAVRGERRILTIVFSDLVNWTSLTETMDIEDCREILEAARLCDSSREAMGLGVQMSTPRTVANQAGHARTTAPASASIGENRFAL